MPRHARFLATLLMGFALPTLLVNAQQPGSVAAPANPLATATGPTYYTIELIVFRSTGNPGTGEDLTAQSSRSLSGDTDSAPAMPDPGTVRLGQKLPASRFRMADTAARLNSSGAWRTVAHAAWTQTASAWGSRSGLSAAQVGLEGNGIEGAIYFERGQLLHLGLNLTFAGNAGTYTLTDIRRVKFNERNYFDHPLYGVIAMVSPANAAAAAQD